MAAQRSIRRSVCWRARGTCRPLAANCASRAGLRAGAEKRRRAGNCWQLGDVPVWNDHRQKERGAHDRARRVHHPVTARWRGRRCVFAASAIARGCERGFRRAAARGCSKCLLGSKSGAGRPSRCSCSAIAADVNTRAHCAAVCCVGGACFACGAPRGRAHDARSNKAHLRQAQSAYAVVRACESKAG